MSSAYMSGARSMTSRHEVCSRCFLAETWDSCKLSPETMNRYYPSLAQKGLIGPQELILDGLAEFAREVPLEPVPVDSVFEPAGRPRREVVPPRRLIEEM